ncbi:hypothetical protein PCASD_18133 [Puccinia coronata f. sp. avenae]|uniref:Uncharacterized protein n=1 Tax=Puccinia coronata f. sp. avenae TaxID=200324 RepID=A0A2N5SQ00_9BASI|nr:hypothetical protein PCASD_18133 [Puccinia coronata f. sp. avenae]
MCNGTLVRVEWYPYKGTKYPYKGTTRYPYKGTKWYPYKGTKWYPYKGTKYPYKGTTWYPYKGTKWYPYKGTKYPYKGTTWYPYKGTKWYPYKGTEWYPYKGTWYPCKGTTLPLQGYQGAHVSLSLQEAYVSLAGQACRPCTPVRRGCTPSRPSSRHLYTAGRLARQSDSPPTGRWPCKLGMSRLTSCKQRSRARPLGVKADAAVPGVRRLGASLVSPATLKAPPRPTSQHTQTRDGTDYCGFLTG